MGSGEFNAGGSPCDGLVSHPGRSRNTSSWRNANKEDLDSWENDEHLFSHFTKVKENKNTHRLYTIYLVDLPPSSHNADIKVEGQISREIRFWSKEKGFLGG